MTLPRLRAMHAYWLDNPPLHQLVKAFIGYKPQKPVEPMVEPPEYEE